MYVDADGQEVGDAFFTYFDASGRTWTISIDGGVAAADYGTYEATQAADCTGPRRVLDINIRARAVFTAGDGGLRVRGDTTPTEFIPMRGRPLPDGGCAAWEPFWDAYGSFPLPAPQNIPWPSFRYQPPLHLERR